MQKKVVINGAQWMNCIDKWYLSPNRILATQSSSSYCGTARRREMSMSKHETISKCLYLQLIQHYFIRDFLLICTHKQHELWTKKQLASFAVYLEHSTCSRSDSWSVELNRQSDSACFSYSDIPAVLCPRPLIRLVSLSHGTYCTLGAPEWRDSLLDEDSPSTSSTSRSQLWSRRTHGAMNAFQTGPFDACLSRQRWLSHRLSWDHGVRDNFGSLGTRAPQCPAHFGPHRDQWVTIVSCSLFCTY